MKRRPYAQIWFGQEMGPEVKRTRRGYLHAWPGRRFMYRTNSLRQWSTQRLQHDVILARRFIQKLCELRRAEEAAESPMKKIKAD